MATWEREGLKLTFKSLALQPSVDLVPFTGVGALEEGWVGSERQRIQLLYTLTPKTTKTYQRQFTAPCL